MFETNGGRVTDLVADVDTPSMAEDYWERQFREADEEAALLAEASVAELVEIYLASGEDFDLSSMCFGALQRRPKRALRRKAWEELRAVDADRKAFGVDLLSLADRDEHDRRHLVPVFVALLQDSDPKVVESALSALNSATLDLNSSEYTRRVRASTDERYSPRWADLPLPFVTDEAHVAPLICHPDASVRHCVSGFVFEFCGTADATAILIGLTWDPDEDVRAGAALSLGRRSVGGEIGPSVERLWELVDDESRYVRAGAVAALVDLGEKDAEPRVEAELRSATESQKGHVYVFPLVNLALRRPELAPDDAHPSLAKLRRAMEERSSSP